MPARVERVEDLGDSAIVNLDSPASGCVKLKTRAASRRRLREGDDVFTSRFAPERGAPVRPHSGAAALTADSTTTEWTHMERNKPNIVLILNDDMGYLRPRLLRRRDRDAQPRPPRRRRPALLAVLQHRALQPVARLAADRPASAPDRHRHPHLRLRARGLRRQPQPALRDDPAGAQGQRLPHLHERQVARRRAT